MIFVKDMSSLISAEDLDEYKNINHLVFGVPLIEISNLENGLESIILGGGCFWGMEEILWQIPGVTNTAVGYSGGHTVQPSYELVCTDSTNHAEVTCVTFDPKKVSLEKILSIFWQSHDPTQGMRQGNDIGSSYRSVIFPLNQTQYDTVIKTESEYQGALNKAGYGRITTEIIPARNFYFAENYHQQYLIKHPNGYRCHSSAGVPYPIKVDK